MVTKYNSVIHTVDAIMFSFETLKEIYEFLKFADVSYSVKNRTLYGIITGKDGVKLNVNKNDYVVRDSDGNITIWKYNDFNKEFVEVKN